MNERIENLAQGCFEYFEGTLDGDIVEFNYKKFAELIVAECMKTCDETQAAYLKYRKESDDFQDKTMYHEGEAACYIVKYKLKKQFGVQE